MDELLTIPLQISWPIIAALAFFFFSNIFGSFLEFYVA